jgi:hypothetical protein
MNDSPYELMVTDTQRLDWLEAFAKKNGGMLEIHVQGDIRSTIDTMREEIAAYEKEWMPK